MNHGRQKGEFVTPQAILALMEQEGPTRAAKELGVSTTTLFKARRGGQVSRVYEVAAAAILGLKMPAREAAPARVAKVERELLMFEVPKEKEDIIRRAVRSLGGEVVN